VQLRAATVANAIRNAVNVPGELSVTSARASGGSIVLGGGSGGNVSVTGRLKASGRTAGGTIAVGGHNVALRQAKLAASSATGQGGAVVVTGTNAVSLASTAVDASGATGGGAIRIGGDFHGASDITSAETTTIDSASTLNASATSSGNGGTVAVWSNGTTSFAGQIAATGGPGGGAGGYAEVSANPLTHGVLGFTGSADLAAPKGTVGTLLLDPYDIVISTGTNSGGSFVNGVWVPTATSVINNALLDNQLALSNVVVSTGLVGSPGSDAGNITVSAPIAWSSNFGLTLTAANTIAIDAPISVNGGGQVTLNYNTSAVDNLSFFGGKITFAPGFCCQALTINQVPYTLLYSMNDVQTKVNADLSGAFALAGDLSSTTTFTQAVVAPGLSEIGFSGQFEGLGHTITGLTINDVSGVGNDGLFGFSTGVIRDLYLTNGLVSAPGATNVGGLIGLNAGTIYDAYFVGSVAGLQKVGGLIGDNALAATAGTVQAGSSIATVNGSLDVGGLVGENDASISQSGYFEGSVKGQTNVGGLVGANAGLSAISNSFSTGAVIGATNVGGLVGANGGSISETLATGAVAATGTTTTGGLVGVSNGTVQNSYWDTLTSGQTISAGGTALTTAQLQGALPAGFAAPWATGPGLYPFLTTYFPNGVQAVSGFAYASPGNPLVSGSAGANTVSVAANGAIFGAATTGANGHYYVFGPASSLPSGTRFVAYTQANATTGAANSATYNTGSSGVPDTSGVNVTGTWQVDLAGSVGSLSGLNAADAAAAASLAPSTFALPNRQIDFGPGSFALDANVNLSGTLALEGAGSVTQPSGAITAGSLLLAGGSFALGSANNSIVTLAAAVANLNLTVGPTLTVGTAADSSNVVISGITSFGTTNLTSTSGGIRLASLINVPEEFGPVSLTAAGDIVQQSGAAIDATNLAMNSTGGGIVLGAPINATGSASFTAGGGAGILQQTGADITTQAGLTMTATTGPITLDALVDPAGPVSLTALGDIVEGAGSPGITATALSAISTTGRVVLTAANNVVSVSGSAPLGFSIADALPLSVGGITSTSGPIALGSLDGITQTGPIKGQSLYAGTVMGDIILTNANNSVAAIAGTAGVTDDFLASIATSIGRPLPPGIVAGPGTFQFYDANPNLSIGAVNFYASVASNTPVLGSASGLAATASNGAGISIAVSNVGNLAVDSAVRSLSPVGTVQLAATGAFTNNVGPSAIATSGGNWQVYSANPADDVFGGLNSNNTAIWSTTFGEPVTAPGDRYVFAFDPTITVTSINDRKTYGTDVTSRVASDFVVSGLEPGVAGAFLGDSASAVFSGTPDVTSLGSPARASVAGSPYQITVAQGTFAVSDGYTLVLDSAGKLAVAPLPITFSVANANSFFGTTPILGPATLFGVLPGDTVDPTLAAFTGLTPVALNPLTPVGRYAVLVTALSNPDYRIAPAPNFPGVLTVSAPTANPGAPSDPGFLPGLTQINNPAPSEYDVGGYDQVLPRFTVDCNEPPSLPDPNRYSDPDQALRAISQSFENYFRRCQNPTQNTIADALDAYAAKLQVLAPRLPPALRNVPTIIAEGARRVRAARSRTEAVAALRETVAAVHKEIALVLSEDPGTRSRELRDGDVITGALGATSVALVNSGGL
jgi:hypothetical protein